MACAHDFLKYDQYWYKNYCSLPGSCIDGEELWHSLVVLLTYASQ
jgi:hypothetical protein